MTAAHRHDVGVASQPGNSVLDPESRTIVRWTSWGSLLPVVGWVYGIGTLWTSRRFSRGDKVMGALLFPGGWFGAAMAVLLIGSHSVEYCWATSVGAVGSSSFVTDSGCVPPDLPAVVGIPLVLAVLVAAALGPVYLRARARRWAAVGGRR